MTIYKYAPGSRFGGDPAEVVAEFERIRAEHGALQPEVIVEEGAAEDNPLHLPQFLWDDDDQAAREFRLEVARRLIRAIVIDEGKGDDNQRKYVYTERDYVPLAGITAEPGRYMQALASARRDLEAAQRRVDDLLYAAKATKGRKTDVASIMLAVQALQTANEAIHALH